MIPLNYPKDLVEGSECLDCEFPWVVKEAAEFLNENLKDTDVVLEFGSGGSTFFFARRCRFVLSVETSAEWYDTVFKRLNEEMIDNFEYWNILRETEMLEWIDGTNFENATVLSVDTQGGYNRSAILNEVLKKNLPNLRMVILDNYGHEGLFPGHWDDYGCGLDGNWVVRVFKADRWAGDGTKIIYKP